jgi:hypothetical protein
VDFGGSAASSFTVDSATQITATAPAGSPGTVDVTVATAGGTSADTASDEYMYVVAPTVSDVSPSSGPSSGGTTVTITGTAFTNATAVDFGGSAASSFTVDSATQITATAPAQSAGTVNVTVTTAGGTSAQSANDQYTYVAAAPTVSSVSVAPVTQTTGTVDFSIDPNGSDTTYQVEYGPTASYGEQTPSVDIGSTPGAQQLHATLAALNPGTTYHFEVVATNAKGPGTSGDDTFTTQSSGGSSPPGPSPPSGSATRPAIGNQPPSATSSTAAGFAGFVNPEGSATTAYFEYGLDPSYTGGGAVVYSSTTPMVAVGAGSSSVRVSAPASGLVPNAIYHVRLVATNGAGTTFGPDQTFRTKEDPPPPAPVLGKSFNLSVVSGRVFIKLPGGALRDHLAATKGVGFVPLTEPRQLPAGTQVDSRLGTLQLVAASGAKHGRLQTGTFGGALFGLGQSSRGASKGLTTLSMLEGAFSGAPSYASCKAKAAGDLVGAQAAKLSSKVLQTLHASAHGKFSTKGKYAAATVLGTAWTISDRCNGTLVHVIRHAVQVQDLVRHIKVIVHAGHSYLARAP